MEFFLRALAFRNTSSPKSHRGVPNAHRPKSQFAFPTWYSKRPRLSTHNRCPGRMGAKAKRLTHPWPVVRATKLTPTWPPVDATRRPPPWPLARATRCLVRATKARTAQTRLLQPRAMVRRGHSVRACRSPPWRCAGLSQKQSLHSKRSRTHEPWTKAGPGIHE